MLKLKYISPIMVAVVLLAGVLGVSGHSVLVHIEKMHDSELHVHNQHRSHAVDFETAHLHFHFQDKAEHFSAEVMI